MGELKRLPDAELEVMMIIWEAEGTVTSDYIMERIDKDWAKTTLLNLLIRLCDSGFVKCDKVGKHNTYTAIVDKDEYLKIESKNFFKKLHHNSLTSLVATLYSVNDISKDDLEELKKFIEEAK